MPRVIIDPGHSEKFVGARGVVEEENWNVDIMNALRKYVDFDITPDPDATTANNQLIKTIQWINANYSSNDILISIHGNAGGGHGVEVWYYGGDASSQQKGVRLSQLIAESTGLPNRGAKPDTDSRYGQFGIVRETKPWAWLVENGFVDNAEDMSKGPEAYARGIAKFLEEQGVAVRWPESPKPEEPKPTDPHEVEIANLRAEVNRLNDVVRSKDVQIGDLVNQKNLIDRALKESMDRENVAKEERDSAYAERDAVKNENTGLKAQLDARPKEIGKTVYVKPEYTVKSALFYLATVGIRYVKSRLERYNK